MKKILACVFAAAIIFALPGCGGGDTTTPPADATGTDAATPAPAVTDKPTDIVGSATNALQASGREYGKIYDLKQDEIMKTAFFEVKVNAVATHDEIEEYIPNEDGRKFLVINATITNVFEDDSEIPMYGNDFELTWDQLDGATAQPEAAFAKDQFPDEYTIFKGDNKTGDIIFVIPADATNLKLVYNELWDDEFEGNTYNMSLTVA